METCHTTKAFNSSWSEFSSISKILVLNKKWKKKKKKKKKK